MSESEFDAISMRYRIMNYKILRIYSQYEHYIYI
jgi:hypothetical protein